MRVMVSCAEASGDLYAGALTAELRARVPGLDVYGLGGRHLSEAGGRLIGDFSAFSVTGITEVWRVMHTSLAMIRHLVETARRERPDVFVAIDSPDLNFRVMKPLHALGIRVVYYISPQLWAWRAGRMRTMKENVDRVLVIFPFEEPIYRAAGVDVQFVGHPLVDLIRVTEPRAEFLRAHGLDPAAPTVALLPGSRRNELDRLGPELVRAMPLIRAQVPRVQFVVACAPNLSNELFASFAHAASASGHTPPRLVLVRDRTDDALAAADVAVTASGTATVQCALHECPTVVVYRLSPLTYALGKPFVHVDTYAMPNLVAGRRIVPELIQHGCTPERIAAETVSLLTDTARHAEMRQGLAEVRRRLGISGASGRAAEAVIEIARRA